MLSRPKIFISRCVVYHACMIHFKRIIAFVTVAALSLALVACANTGDSKNGGTSASALSALFPTGTVVLQDRPDRLLVQLPNGLLILTQELHTQPVVTTQAWVKTGSIFEQEHVGQGLSHFLEHLLAGGTTDKRPEGETNKILGIAPGSVPVDGFCVRVGAMRCQTEPQWQSSRSTAQVMSHISRIHF